MTAYLNALGVICALGNGKAEVADGGSFRGVAQFRIPGEIPDEHDFVEVCHNEVRVGDGVGEGKQKLFKRTIFRYRDQAIRWKCCKCTLVLRRRRLWILLTVSGLPLKV